MLQFNAYRNCFEQLQQRYYHISIQDKNRRNTFIVEINVFTMRSINQIKDRFRIRNLAHLIKQRKNRQEKLRSNYKCI